MAKRCLAFTQPKQASYETNTALNVGVSSFLAMDGRPFAVRAWRLCKFESGSITNAARLALPGSSRGQTIHNGAVLLPAPLHSHCVPNNALRRGVAGLRLHSFQELLEVRAGQEFLPL